MLTANADTFTAVVVSFQEPFSIRNIPKNILLREDDDDTDVWTGANTIVHNKNSNSTIYNYCNLQLNTLIYFVTSHDCWMHPT